MPPPRVLAAAASVLLVAVAVVPGSAHTKRSVAAVSVTGAERSGSAVVVTGVVSSSKAACRDRRIVVTAVGAGTTIGKGRSDDGGAFAVDGTLDEAGDAQVKVKATRKEIRRSSSHVHVCRAATSDAVAVTDASGVDLTALPVGDGRYSTSPTRGYIYSCQTTFNGGGASTQGPWFNGDGTWDLTEKEIVDGAASWPHQLSVSLSGDARVFGGNNLPEHSTGAFPVAQSDDAYQYDRNPNSISEQDVAFSLDATPVLLATPECAGGSVGYMLSGAYLFNGFDAGGRDAVAWEVQDACDGHPQNTGVYHYHSLSDCSEGAAGKTHSGVLGYAFDGFGIFGHYGVDGETLTNEDLDECHGHTHSIEWDDVVQSMYHYHSTYEFPYTVSCFRGDAIRPQA